MAACDAALSQPSSIPAEHGIDEDAAYATKQLAVVSERRPQLEGQREHELTERDLLWQNVVDPVGGALRHAPAHARRTEPSPAATERDQLSLLTARTGKHGKASRKHSARDVAFELIAHERRQSRGEALLDGGIEREQVFAHHLVQGRALWPAPFVGVLARDASRSGWCRHAPRRARAHARNAACLFRY